MKKILNILSIWLLLAGLISCSEEMPSPHTLQTSATSILIELPYSESVSATRAIPTGNAIRTLDVLAFDENGKYLYRSESKSLYSIDNGKTYLYTIDIQQQDIAPNQSFVFIANLRDRVEAACTGAEGKSKEALVSQLTFIDCNWATAKTGVPMWSETAESHDVTSRVDVLDKVKLIRSVAAIEVLLNGDLNDVYGLDNFKISDVAVKDFQSEGLVAPSPENHQWDAQNNRYLISAPSIPENSAQGEGYTLSAGAPANSIKGQLFVPEFDASRASDEKQPCLLIGGYYGKGNTATKSWYKVALVKDGKYIDVLRNTQYVLNISAVTAEGFTTPEEAYANPSQNMRATLEMTTESTAGLNNVVYDASSFLATSESEIQIQGQTASTFEVLTNASGGWKIDSKPEWVNVSAAHGEKDVKAVITVTSTEASKDLRSGEMIITAGLLKLKIQVSEVKSNQITYITATAEQIINATTLGIPSSEFTLSGGVAFNGKYLYIGNSYYKRDNGVFTKRPALIVYDMETQKVVKKIEEWNFNGSKLNFEGNTTYPDAINDIVFDPKDNRLYIMRQHHAVEVFDVSNPENPVYVTRMGELLSGGQDAINKFRHSSAVGVCDRAVLVRARKVLNTYERSTITSANWQKISRKTTDDRNLLDLSDFTPRQFAADDRFKDKIWLTESGNNTFKGIYLMDVSSMDLSNQFNIYRDMREKSISLSYSPTGMAIVGNKVYLTRSNGTIDILDRNELYQAASRSIYATEEAPAPQYRSEMKDYAFGNMIKLYPGKEEETFWSCDRGKNNLVLIKVGKGTIIM